MQGKLLFSINPDHDNVSAYRSVEEIPFCEFVDPSQYLLLKNYGSIHQTKVSLLQRTEMLMEIPLCQKEPFNERRHPETRLKWRLTERF